MKRRVKPSRTWRLEKKQVVSTRDIILTRLLSIGLALAIAGGGIALLGESPLFMAQRALDATLGSWRGMQQVLVYWVPVTLLGLAVIVAMRAGAWNLGVQGQYFIGTLAAAAVGKYANLPAFVSIMLMLAASAAAGSLWALIPALAKVSYGVNELVTTFLLNFTASSLVMYFLSGPMRDTKLSYQIATPRIAHTLFVVPGTQINVGVVLPIVLALAMTLAFRHLRWGYELTVVGVSIRTAQYVGLPARRHILTAMLLSGAIAGAVGMLNLAGTTYRMNAGSLAVQYGYEGFLIAALADFSPLAMIPAGFLYSVLLNSGIALQTRGLTTNFVEAITGLVLLLSTVGATLAGYRLKRQPGFAEQGKAGPPGPMLTAELADSQVQVADGRNANQDHERRSFERDSSDAKSVRGSTRQGWKA
jgi:simple sugar transport system permease protein